MLFAKPYILWKEQKERSQSGHRQLGIVQKVLVVLAVVQVPVMLLVKPLILRSRSRAAEAHYFTLRDESVRADMNGDDAEVVHSEPKTTVSSGGHGGHGAGEKVSFILLHFHFQFIER
ncbi:unnamed protein product [Nippostrongylus brasiliensis]|uniref:Uncharacterized protein n=1 Tax=Nippostrongylus brasiliensis TaxID=27835 RepID=A0A0N4XM80_NIPBR|nr:unnamed protein product [Nippostrongylus brasiliensis]